MLSAKVKNRIKGWAESESLVTKVYVFGSRARKDYEEESDLDIAVEIQRSSGDGNLLATWIFEADGLKERLSKEVPEYKIDLQWLNGEETEVVKMGIEESSYVVYEQ